MTAQRMRDAKAAKRVSPDAPELTAFEGFFVEAYILNGGNATRAYRTARGGGPLSVKDSTCAVEGCRLLRLPKIRAALEARRQERFRALRMEPTKRWRSSRCGRAPTSPRPTMSAAGCCRSISRRSRCVWPAAGGLGLRCGRAGC
jgi:hypothetical protein